MLAQFAYVGAQVGVWSFVIRYTQFNSPGTAEKVAANNLLITLALFFAGRFIGTLLMSKFRPALLLATFAAVDVALCITAAIAGGNVGLYALMATSFFMSIQFPTIFTMSLRGLGEHTKSGSSFLVMAIVGGAVIPPVMGLVSDASTINIAMLRARGVFRRGRLVRFQVAMSGRAPAPHRRTHRTRGDRARLRRRGHR